MEDSKNRKTEIKKYLRMVWPELAFSAGMIAFLVKLFHLNEELIAGQYTNNAIMLISYDDFKPLKYFAVAVVFAIIGVLLISYKLSRIKNSEESFGEIVVSLAAVLAIAALILLLIILINNPILKAILTCLCFIIGGGYLIAS